MKLAKNYAEKSGALSAYIDMIRWEVNRINESDNEYTREYSWKRIEELVRDAKEIADAPITATD